MTTRPPDWDAHEDDLPDALRRDLDALASRHRADPPVDLLRASVAGALPDDLDEVARASLASNPWNRAMAAGADDAEATLDEMTQARLLARVKDEAARHPAPPRSGRLTGGRPLLPLLALAATILVALVVLRWRTRSPEAPTAAVAVTAPAAVFQLPIEKPAVRLTALALVLRSDAASGGFTDAIAPGLDAYKRGDYQTAAGDFHALRATYPTSVELPFYEGVSLLLLGNASSAIPALTDARRVTDESFRSDIAWYLAVADDRAGQIPAARAELEGLCTGTSLYAARACDARTKVGSQ